MEDEGEPICKRCGNEKDVREFFGEGEVKRKEITEGGAMMRRLVDPRMPTKQEIEEHEPTHLPYRNWCGVCVRAKGKDLDHRQAVGRERQPNECAFDYCFPGDELGCKLLVLVGGERKSGMVMATRVPIKGSSESLWWIRRWALWKSVETDHMGL